MRKVTFILLVPFFLTGCKFSRSVEKDLVSGLISTGKDLACEDVYLKSGETRISGNTFTYGETFLLCFDNITGFTSENGNVFPGMELVITGSGGDTLMFAGDLYSSYTGGINFSPLQLTADLTVADPIKSKGEYSLVVRIWDKKGSGTFSSSLDFSVRENEKITAVPEGVTWNEAYLFSQGSGKVITDNIIRFDDNIYLIVEGLRGFAEENGNVFPGLELTGTDSRGNMILEYEDLFSDYSAAGISASDFSFRVSAHFRLTGTSFNNPLTCKMRIWDKKSDASLIITTDMTVR